MHELRGLEQRLGRPGVVPRRPAPHLLHRQVASTQVRTVEVGDLQLLPPRRLQASRQCRRVGVVQVQPRHRPARRRFGGLFHDVGHRPLRVVRHHAVGLGVRHLLGKDRRTTFAYHGPLHLRRQVVPEEEVVAEYQRACSAIEEVLANYHRLGDAARRGLRGVRNLDPPRIAGAKKSLKERRINRRRDDQELPHPREHQRAQRVVDHRLVEHREQLLAERPRRRGQPRTAPAGENDARSATA